MRPGRAFSEKVIGDTLYPVTIRKPEAAPWVDPGKMDGKSQPIMVACAACHDTRAAYLKITDGALLKEFHQGLKYAHGSQTCLSCHNAGDYNTLKLADGQAVDFYESMRVCAQCHCPKYRDYQNGSRGGMTGHWDLKQGPCERSHYTDCHDPHHPAYPRVMPVFPPKQCRKV